MTETIHNFVHDYRQKKTLKSESDAMNSSNQLDKGKIEETTEAKATNLVCMHKNSERSAGLITGFRVR